MSAHAGTPKRLGALVVAAIALACAVLLVGCRKETTSPSSTGPSKHKVTVRIILEADGLHAHPSTVVLSKGGHELIEWECLAGAAECKMDFDPDPTKRPFKQSHFEKNGAQSDEPVVGYDPANPCKRYKYTVSVPGAGVPPLDPDVIVEK